MHNRVTGVFSLQQVEPRLDNRNASTANGENMVTKRSRIALVPILAVGLFSGLHLHAQQLGNIRFPSSGATVAQPSFIEGVKELHSFQFDEAAIAFQRAEKIDPNFGMAYWGEAMSHNHPLWAEVNVDAAKKALEKLAPTLDGRVAKAPTPKEKAYLQTVNELFYTPGNKLARDNQAWLPTATTQLVTITTVRGCSSPDIALPNWVTPTQPSRPPRNYMQWPSGLHQAENTYAAKPFTIMEKEVSSVSQLSRGQKDDAVRLAKEAADVEATMSAPSGPPDPIKTAVELYGEILLDAGRHVEAAAAFEKSLQRTPNRTASVKGLAQPTKSGGNLSSAR